MLYFSLIYFSPLTLEENLIQLMKVHIMMTFFSFIFFFLYFLTQQADFNKMTFYFCI